MLNINIFKPIKEISEKLFQLLMKTKKRVKNNQRKHIIHQYCDNKGETGVFILDPDNSKPR